MLEKLKLLLGIASTDEAKIAFAEHALETATNAVLNYCNRNDTDEIPAGLQTIIENVAIDIYRASNLGNEEEGAGPVKSITVGDTTTTFETKKMDADFLRPYTKELKPFRKVAW